MRNVSISPKTYLKMARPPPPPPHSRHLDLSDDEDISNAESLHSRRSGRSHSTNTGGSHHGSHHHSRHNSRHNSSNCINIYSSYTDPLQSGADDRLPHDDRGVGGGGSAHGSHGSHVNVRRSASGVFRYPNEDSENQFSDQLYLLENGCNNRHQNIMSDYTVEDMYHSPKDPFDG